MVTAARKKVSPALAWAGAPKGVKSFALSVYDPDAPTGGGFWRWVVFNIPADTTALPKGAVRSRTGFDVPGYGGPCPPKGDKPHHDRFTVYALYVDKIEAYENASAAFIDFHLHSHTLAKATLTGAWGH